MPLNQLKPAPDATVIVYQPYYQGTKRNALPFGISLYQEGYMEGERHIEGGDSIPFVAQWDISSLPMELTRCRVQFDNNADLSYQLQLPNHELVDFLIDAYISYRKAQIADFPNAFYRKLLRVDE